MSKVVLTGSLEFLSLGDTLQLIGTNGSTGVLRIISKYFPEPGHIYFKKGNIINGSTPSKKGLDAVFSLFGWQEGEFEFTERDVEMAKAIEMSRMQIILDGLRLIDDGQTETVGPATPESRTQRTEGDVPLLKGPLVDYLYVVDEERFYQGYKIVQENRHGNWIWVILEGTVEINKETSRGLLPVLHLGPGAFIGSVASFIFRDNVRRATALALTDVQLGVLDTQRLTEEYNLFSPDLKNFILSLDRRRTQITNAAVDVFLKRAEPKKLIKGKKQIVKQGQKEDNKLYQIKEGEVSIVQKTEAGMIPLATLGSGNCFGSVPFLDIGHEPIGASVYASKDFEVRKLDTGALEEEYNNDISPMMRNLIESTATSVNVTTRVVGNRLKESLKEK